MRANENIYNSPEYSGGHREADVTVDDEFPGLEGVSLPVANVIDLAFTVSTIENSEIMSHTISTGRAGFYPLSFEAGGRVYNTLFVKGTGMPRVYTQAGESEAPFGVHNRASTAELDASIGNKRDVLGICTRKDQVYDAEVSKELHAKGLKVRMPISGFYLDAIETEHGVERVDDLVHRGLISDEERPYMSYWAMETPFRISDLSDFVHNGNDSELRTFLIDAVRYTRGIDSGAYQEFRRNFQDRVSTDSTTAELLELWTDFILDNVEDSLSAMAGLGVVHNNLHAQNISLHGEICDNSEVDIVADNELARRSFGRDVRVFTDGIYGIWKYYSEQHSGEYTQQRENYEARVGKIFLEYTR